MLWETVLSLNLTGIKSNKIKEDVIMKKVMIVFMALTMLLPLAGCGGSSTASGSSAAGSSTAQPSCLLYTSHRLHSVADEWL